MALRGRYDAKVVNRDFDGDPNKISEMDALVSYLQMLGTGLDEDAADAADAHGGH